MDTLLQRTRDLIAPLSQLLDSKDAMTFDSRFDAFETAFVAWGSALQAIDRTNTQQMNRASDIADKIILPRVKEVNELSKRLGASKGQKASEPSGTTGARRLRRRSKTGRRARKATRRGR